MSDYPAAMSYVYIFAILVPLLFSLMFIEEVIRGKAILIGIRRARAILGKAVLISAIMTSMTAVYVSLGVGRG